MARHKLYSDEEIKNCSYQLYASQRERLQQLKKEYKMTWAQLFNMLLNEHDERMKGFLD